MIRIIRQTIRGCTDLPYVGTHPGTSILLAFIPLSIVGGMSVKLDIIGGLFAGGIVPAFLVPVYLIGAYSRAQESDRACRRVTRMLKNAN